VPKSGGARATRWYTWWTPASVRSQVTFPACCVTLAAHEVEQQADDGVHEGEQHRVSLPARAPGQPCFRTTHHSTNGPLRHVKNPRPDTRARAVASLVKGAEGEGFEPSIPLRIERLSNCAKTLPRPAAASRRCSLPPCLQLRGPMRAILVVVVDVLGQMGAVGAVTRPPFAA
jgi:hypothetical protein